MGLLHTHEGAPELILVHIEIQADAEKEIVERMFEYYVLLRRRHGSPVFPIAVYLRGGKGLSEEEYQETIESVADLDTYLERVLTAESIDDMGL